jgi:hypothetical protein
MLRAPILRRPLTLAALAVLSLPPVAACAQSERLDLTAAEWRQDLVWFAREIPKRHGNAFHFTPRERFEAAVADLDRKIDGLNPDQIYVGLDQLANLIGDAHTYVRFPKDSPDFPLAFRRFGADYRMVVVAPGFERALGARLIAIGDSPVAQVRERVLTLTPADETPDLREANLAAYLANGVVMHGLGISARRDTLRCTLADSAGTEFTVVVPAAPPGAPMPKRVWAYTDPPLYRHNPDQGFWTQWLPDARTVYCCFRRYDDLGKHAHDLFALIDQRHPDKLVIDLRQNTGGDYTQGQKHIVDPIAGRADVNRRGHLFVLVGALTFSAAMNNAAQFRSRTAALLVGGTIGERPNSWQEPREATLPNSRLTVRYSTRFYEFAKGGENVLRPDQEIVPSWDDYRAGRDPVLDWVLAQAPKP